MTQPSSTIASLPALPDDLPKQVEHALAEDIQTGDITAELIHPEQTAKATVIARETAIICGQPWFNAVFSAIDPTISLTWMITEGTRCEADQALLHIEGNARGILTAERTALNFLQTLSGTATTTHQWTEQIKSTSTKILDTRKTLPGLRTAQKYAVAVGGGQNHRMGLYDQFLIKENHIMAAGSLEKAVERARQNHPEIIVEVEVETLDEYEQALAVGADIIMLDNFSVTDIIQAVTLRSQHLARCKLEVSGGIEQAGLLTLAQTGIDYISVGALTKHLRAIDLSMRFSLQPDD